MSSNDNTWVIHRPKFEADELNPDLAVSPWAGHRNFCYDLTRFVRPSCIVELGTHFGCSFFTFLQALKDQSSSCSCYAVDTWRGDEHAGFYDDSVFNLVKTTVDSRFSELEVHLLRETFDSAVKNFPTDSIDILHIDGFHSYDAVKHDFETWKEKLAKDAIVLFHDVAPSTGYGSSDYWKEVKLQYPHLEFLHHSWGLGILFPTGDRWYRQLQEKLPELWEEHYRIRAENELVARQLADTTHLLEQRWKIIENQGREIAEQATALESQRRTIHDLEDANSEVERRTVDEIMRLKTIVKALSANRRISALLASIDDIEEAEFVDIAYALFLFIAKLHDKLSSQRVEKVLFFSREGWVLKELFDFYQSQLSTHKNIESIYFEISRRSSFLPSLGPLKDEGFDTLFRQYRRISVRAFLSSLALDDFANAIAGEIGYPAAAFDEVKEDLPTDPIFEELVTSKAFSEIYEHERKIRSEALRVYVQELFGGSVPTDMHVVDVGWKGTIQDNLFNWMIRACSESASVTGYYIGLIAPGNLSARNRKEGLLFSSLGQPTPGYHVFDENKSLFEVLLPALHGSPRSYTVTEEGTAQVIRDAFVEKELLDQHVGRVVAAVTRRFKLIAELLGVVPWQDEDLLRNVLAKHSRMVFQPSVQEVEWLKNVTHVENFGVFEESRFDNVVLQSYRERTKFTWNLFAGGKNLGFWPYLTLRDRALPGIALSYKLFRLHQTRRTFPGGKYEKK